MGPEQSVKIILQFVDQASGPLQGAIATIGQTKVRVEAIGSAFQQMSGNVQRAMLGSIASFSPFQGAMSGLVGIVGGAVGLIKNFITGLADHMRWASLFIGSAAIGIGASMVKMAGGLEQTRIGFETLLKDNGKVKDALSFIQDWALKTPFSVTEATDSFKRFLAVTGDLDLTKKYLQNLGDAVVATGGNINEFNFAARAMTQIQAMSKVRAQEMYQLVNANIPAFDILAKAVKEGKMQVEAFGDANQVASMSMEDIKSQLQNIGDLNISGAEAAKVFSAYFEQAYGGAAERSTTTLIGRLGVLKDQIVFSAAALIGYNQATGESYGLYARLGQALDYVNQFLKEHKSQFEALGQILNNNVALYGLLGVALGTLIGFLVGILAPVVMAAAIFGALGIAIGYVITNFNTLLPWITGIGAALLALGVVILINVVPAFIAWAGAAIAAAAATILALLPVLIPIALIGAAVGLLTAAWINNWFGIQDKTKAVVDWFFNIALPLIKDFLNGIKIAAENAGNFFISKFNAIKNAVQGVIDGINNLLNAARNLAKEGGLVSKLGFSFQHGGIVPGPVGAAVPIMAHAGERVVPRGATDVNGGGSGGGVTINFNGALTVDSEDRVRQLADRVIAILGRQNELAKWGMI